jgi:TolB-like protein
MKIIMALLVLLAPGCAGANKRAKSDVYRTLVSELLKNCEGPDKKIAVTDFNYLDERVSGDGNIVSERVTTELVELKKFKVTERKEIEKVFVELKLQRSGAIDVDSVKSIGKMLGADWIILGTLAELPGRQIEVNARLVGVESGEIINAYSAQIKKDWSDKTAKDITEENEFRENSDLREYDKAILKYMDGKIGKKADQKTPPEQAAPGN